MLFGMFYYKQNMFFNDTTAPANWVAERSVAYMKLKQQIN